MGCSANNTYGARTDQSGSSENGNSNLAIKYKKTKEITVISPKREVRVVIFSTPKHPYKVEGIF